MQDLQHLKSELESRKREIDEQIDHYPSPITACDAQFNYLLEERERILLELKKLQESYRDL